MANQTSIEVCANLPSVAAGFLFPFRNDGAKRRDDRRSSFRQDRRNPDAKDGNTQQRRVTSPPSPPQPPPPPPPRCFKRGLRLDGQARKARESSCLSHPYPALFFGEFQVRVRRASNIVSHKIRCRQYADHRVENIIVLPHLVFDVFQPHLAL